MSEPELPAGLRPHRSVPGGVVNPWARKCVCGHPLRAHRLDWDDPMDGLAPDCGVTVVVVDPDTWVEHRGLCPCMGFRLRTASNMSP